MERVAAGPAYHGLGGVRQAPVRRSGARPEVPESLYPSVAIANHRVVSIENGVVRFCWRDDADHRYVTRAPWLASPGAPRVLPGACIGSMMPPSALVRASRADTPSRPPRRSAPDPGSTSPVAGAGSRRYPLELHSLLTKRQLHGVVALATAGGAQLPRTQCGRRGVSESSRGRCSGLGKRHSAASSRRSIHRGRSADAIPRDSAIGCRRRARRQPVPGGACAQLRLASLPGSVRRAHRSGHADIPAFLSGISSAARRTGVAKVLHGQVISLYASQEHPLRDCSSVSGAERAVRHHRYVRALHADRGTRQQPMVRCADRRRTGKPSYVARMRRL